MSIPSWAVKGAKVVCINGDWDLMADCPVTRVPMLNEVLTILAALEEGPHVGLTFEEIPSERSSEDGMTVFVDYWSLTAFRPLVTRTQEQDLAEHFAHHLRQPAGVDA